VPKPPWMPSFSLNPSKSSTYKYSTFLCPPAQNYIFVVFAAKSTFLLLFRSGTRPRASARFECPGKWAQKMMALIYSFLTQPSRRMCLTMQNPSRHGHLGRASHGLPAHVLKACCQRTNKAKHARLVSRWHHFLVHPCECGCIREDQL
jgi:hypothetical protein